MRVGCPRLLSLLLAQLLAFQPLLVSCADVAATNGAVDGSSLTCAAASGDVATLQASQNGLMPRLFVQTKRLKELTRDAVNALDREDYAAHDAAGAAIAGVVDEGFRHACSLYANELALAAQGAGRHRTGGGQTTTLDPLTLTVGVISLIALFTAAKKIGNSLDTTPQTDLRQRWVDARTRYLTRFDPDFINSETLARNRAEKDFEASNFRGAMDHLRNVGNVVVDEVGDEIIFNLIGSGGHAVARAVCSLKDGYDITTYQLGDDGRFVPDPANLPDVPGYRWAATASPTLYDETQGQLYFGKGERSTHYHIPDGRWNSRIYADGYVPLDVSFDASGSGTTQYEACAKKIAAGGGGVTDTMPWRYGGTGSMTFTATAGFGAGDTVSCTVPQAITASLNADGSVTATKSGGVFFEFDAGGNGTACHAVGGSDATGSGSHSDGSYSLTWSSGGTVSGFYSAQSMGGSGSRTEDHSFGDGLPYTTTNVWSFTLSRN